MILREYRAQDLVRLHAMDVACFDPRFRFSKKLLARLLNAKNAVAQVGCVDHSPEAPILGFCLASVQRYGKERIGYVSTLDVDPSVRRQGVGRSLLASTEGALLRAGAKRIWLHVWTGNPAAMHLYQRAGYQEHSRCESFYGDNLDALLLLKLLMPAAAPEVQETNADLTDTGAKPLSAS